MSSDYKSMFINDKNRKKLIPLGYKYYEGEYSLDSAYSIWISRSVRHERKISINSTMFPSFLIENLYKFLKKNKDEDINNFQIKTEDFGMMSKYGFYKDKLIDRTISDQSLNSDCDYSSIYWIGKDLIKFLMPLIDDIYLK